MTRHFHPRRFGNLSKFTPFFFFLFVLPEPIACRKPLTVNRRKPVNGPKLIHDGKRMREDYVVPLFIWLVALDCCCSEPYGFSYIRCFMHAHADVHGIFSPRGRCWFMIILCHEFLMTCFLNKSAFLSYSRLITPLNHILGARERSKPHGGGTWALIHVPSTKYLICTRT